MVFGLLTVASISRPGGRPKNCCVSGPVSRLPKVVVLIDGDHIGPPWFESILQAGNMALATICSRLHICSTVQLCLSMFIYVYVHLCLCIFNYVYLCSSMLNYLKLCSMFIYVYLCSYMFIYNRGSVETD